MRRRAIPRLCWGCVFILSKKGSVFISMFDLYGEVFLRLPLFLICCFHIFRLRLCKVNKHLKKQSIIILSIFQQDIIYSSQILMGPDDPIIGFTIHSVLLNFRDRCGKSYKRPSHLIGDNLNIGFYEPSRDQHKSS